MASEAIAPTSSGEAALARIQEEHRQATEENALLLERVKQLEVRVADLQQENQKLKDASGPGASEWEAKLQRAHILLGDKEEEVLRLQRELAQAQGNAGPAEEASVSVVKVVGAERNHQLCLRLGADAQVISGLGELRPDAEVTLKGAAPLVVELLTDATQAVARASVPVGDAQPTVELAHAGGVVSVSLRVQWRGLDLRPLSPGPAPRLLQVTVVRATGLHDGDVLGKSDPFATLSLQDQIHSTSTKKGTLAPVWNEAFTFHVDAEQELRVEVWDKDIVGTDFLGSATVDISAWGDSGAAAVPLYGKNGTAAGEVALEYQWMDASPRRNDAAEVQQLRQQLTTRTEECIRLRRQLAEARQLARAANNVLRVTVLKATNLPRDDCDPFALVTIGPTAHRTSAKSATPNPIWEECYAFAIDNTHQELVVEVHDYISKKVLGVGQMPLPSSSRALTLPLRPPDATDPSVTAGEVHLAFAFAEASTLSGPPSEAGSTTSSRRGGTSKAMARAKEDWTAGRHRHEEIIAKLEEEKQRAEAQVRLLKVEVQRLKEERREREMKDGSPRRKTGARRASATARPTQTQTPQRAPGTSNPGYTSPRRTGRTRTDPAPLTVKVRVLKVADVVPEAEGEAYVAVAFDGDLQRTTCKAIGFVPVWNELLTFSSSRVGCRGVSPRSSDGIGDTHLLISLCGIDGTALGKAVLPLATVPHCVPHDVMLPLQAPDGRPVGLASLQVHVFDFALPDALPPGPVPVAGNSGSPRAALAAAQQGNSGASPAKRHNQHRVQGQQSGAEPTTAYDRTADTRGSVASSPTSSSSSGGSPLASQSLASPGRVHSTRQAALERERWERRTVEPESSSGEVQYLRDRVAGLERALTESATTQSTMVAHFQAAIQNERARSRSPVRSAFTTVSGSSVASSVGRASPAQQRPSSASPPQTTVTAAPPAPPVPSTAQRTVSPLRPSSERGLPPRPDPYRDLSAEPPSLARTTEALIRGQYQPFPAYTEEPQARQLRRAYDDIKDIRSRELESRATRTYSSAAASRVPAESAPFSPLPIATPSVQPFGGRTRADGELPSAPALSYPRRAEYPAPATAPITSQPVAVQSLAPAAAAPAPPSADAPQRPFITRLGSAAQGGPTGATSAVRTSSPSRGVVHGISSPSKARGRSPSAPRQPAVPGTAGLQGTSIQRGASPARRAASPADRRLATAAYRSPSHTRQ